VYIFTPAEQLLEQLDLFTGKRRLIQESGGICGSILSGCIQRKTAPFSQLRISSCNLAHSASIYLNTGRWEMALESSEHLTHGINPEVGFIGGFAAAELKEHERAVDLFLSAALHKPRAARILGGVRTADPTNYHSAEDHNAGIRLLQNLHEYLASRRSVGKRFYLKFMDQPVTHSLLNEMDIVEDRWHEPHQGGRHEDFDRMHEMRSASFIKAHAQQIAASLDKALLNAEFEQ
jgi:hypothetical protein